MASAGCGDSGFDWGVWLFARSDAIEEILNVVDGAVAEAVCLDYRHVFGLRVFVIDGEAAAVDLQGCFCAAKLEAAVVDGRSHHALVDDIEAGIAKSGLNSVGTFPLFEDEFVAKHLGLARLVGFHGPVHDVDPVGEEIGHGAAAKVPEPAPAVELFFGERLIGSAAEPLLPIEGLGVDGLGRHEELIVLPPVGSDLRDAPEAASLNEIDGVAEVAPAALLHAALQNLFAGAHRALQRNAFLNGVSDRLFQKDVFAGGEGVDGHAHMPVVGRGDDNGVELLLEDFAIIRVSGGDAVGACLDGVAPRRIDVADGADLIWLAPIRPMRRVSLAPRIRVDARAVRPLAMRKLRRVGFCMADILASYGQGGKRLDADLVFAQNAVGRAKEQR